MARCCMLSSTKWAATVASLFSYACIFFFATASGNTTTVHVNTTNHKLNFTSGLNEQLQRLQFSRKNLLTTFSTISHSKGIFINDSTVSASPLDYTKLTNETHFAASDNSSVAADCKTFELEVAFKDTTEVTDNFEFLKTGIVNVLQTLQLSAILYDFLLVVIIIMLSAVLVLQYRSPVSDIRATTAAVKAAIATDGESTPTQQQKFEHLLSPIGDVDLYSTVHSSSSAATAAAEEEGDVDTHYIEKCSALFTDTVRRKSSVSLFRSAGNAVETIISPERTQHATIDSNRSVESTPPRIQRISSATTLYSVNPLFTPKRLKLATAAATVASPARLPLRPLDAIFTTGSSHSSRKRSTNSSSSSGLIGAARPSPFKSSSSSRNGVIGSSIEALPQMSQSADKADTEREHARSLRLLHQQLDEVQNQLQQRDAIIAQLETDLAALQVTRAEAIESMRQQLQQQRTEVNELKTALCLKEEAAAVLMHDFAALGAGWMQTLEADATATTIAETEAPTETGEATTDRVATSAESTAAAATAQSISSSTTFATDSSSAVEAKVKTEVHGIIGDDELDRFVASILKQKTTATMR